MHDDFFQGRFEPKLDAKGRLSIPSSFRSVLAEGMLGKPGLPEVTIVYGRTMGRRLEGYSRAGMAALNARINAMPPGRGREFMIDSMISNSRPFTVDDTGRIVLPQEQRAQLGLPDGGAVTILGKSGRFEIWSSDTYRAERGDRYDAMAAELPEGISVEEMIANPDLFG